MHLDILYWFLQCAMILFSSNLFFLPNLFSPNSNVSSLSFYWQILLKNSLIFLFLTYLALFLNFLWIVTHLPFCEYIVSVQFSHSVMSDSLWPHETQHARPPCPSPTPGVYSNSCPLSLWCHPTVSSSGVPFSYCPQFFPASGPFPMSHLFASSG